MADQDPIIVAVELGTSRIAGIAGKRKDGNLILMAYAEENAGDSIKHGVIYNMEKTTQCVNNVLKKLATRLNLYIDRVYVGIGGQSVLSEATTIHRNLITQSYITNEQMESMRSESAAVSRPDYVLLENFPQEYRVDGRVVETPVGVQGLEVEATYLNVIGRRKLSQNIETCFASARVDIAEQKLSGYELGLHVLTDQEKRAGCVLIDLGAGTTTVVIFSKNILRSLVTIPLGMDNITADLQTLNIEPADAERIKREYANASLDSIETEYGNQPQYVDTSFGQQVELNKIHFVIYARLREIIENVVSQVNQSPYSGSLIGGIVLTGGGARIRNIDEFVKTKFAKFGGNVKVRIAHEITIPVTRQNSLQLPQGDHSDLTTLLSLLCSGTEECTGEPYDDGIFSHREKPVESPSKVAETQEDETNKHRIENYKETARQHITECNAHAEAIRARGASKKVRKSAKKFLDEALYLFDDDYEEWRRTVEDKPQHRQSLRELQELREELEKKIETLEADYKKANKENSFWASFRRGLDEIVNE